MKVLYLLLSCFPFLGFTQENHERAKSFSLFNVVQFKNEGCQSVSDATLQGVCYTAQECTDLGGRADGNCANGFGTCCVIVVSGTTGNCGGTVTQNCSFIENIDYPAAEAAAQTCTYMVTKCSSEICQIRLDFVTTGLGQPTVTTGACDNDNLVITPGTGALAGANPPTLCGTLTGQHVYVDAGTGTNGATLALTTVAANAADGTKNWRIKVSQIECSSDWRAPAGCLQYYTGVTNIFTSFNWNGQGMGSTPAATGARWLSTQDYRICHRQEKGMCKIQYSESPILFGANIAIDAFDLGGVSNGNDEESTFGHTRLLAAMSCGATMEGYIQINGAEPVGQMGIGNNNALHSYDALDVYCGGTLCGGFAEYDANINTACAVAMGSSTVVASAIPFTLQVVQNGNTDNNHGGFSLQSTQIPCGRSDGA